MSLDIDRFRQDGALLVERAISAQLVERLRNLCGYDQYSPRPGRRITEPYPGLLDLILAPDGLASLAERLAGENVRPVRLLLFEKTQSMNWALDWHQDRVIPLARQHVLPGFELWTTKAGTPHVEPPVELMQRMVTLRVHLDDCGIDNAPLQTIRGSHLAGRLPWEEVEAFAVDAADADKTTHTARAGDVLALKTLILHASDRATRPSRRRVLHIDFAPPDSLPQGLDWAFDLPEG